MGDSYGNSKYLLVLKDHVSHYCELVVADTADSTVVVEALLAWHSRFGIPPVWVSDNGTHFKNEVVAELSRRLRTQQTFTPAYSPWVNGSIERVNRDILQVVRAMILSYKISYKDWVYLVPIIQSNLNHTAVPSLGNRAPVELFTGLQCPTPLSEFYLPNSNELQQVPPSQQIDSYLTDLRNSLHEMHCKVEDQRLKQRLLNKKRERGENLVNFAVGDFVLRSRVDEKNGNKLQVTWIGPYRVIRADSHSFRVQHLVTEDELDVHASRLKFYADSSLNVTDELLEHVASQGIILAVNELKEHRWNPDISDYEILVEWKGLQSIEDSYEPLQALAKEIRVLVNNYVELADDQQLRGHWQKISGMENSTPQPQLPANSTPTPPVSAQHEPRGHQRSRKRRHRATGEHPSDVSQRDASVGRATEVLLPHEQLSVRRTPDEDSQEHKSAEGHDFQLPLGRRTRSMTKAATIQRATDQAPTLSSPCARRQLRSQRSSKRRKNRVQRD
uniref:Integrase catalytic domain-containing protein n=1 Tax=Phytophthora ramorum TaxID=164328 RepID=H3H597_PHYRM